MEVINEVYPRDPAQVAATNEPGPQGPIVTINLLKFKDKTEYRGGRDTDLSGRNACMSYGVAVTELAKHYDDHARFAYGITHLALGHRP